MSLSVDQTTRQTNARESSVAHLVSSSISVAFVATAAFTTCGAPAERPGSLRTISLQRVLLLGAARSPCCGIETRAGELKGDGEFQ